MEVVLVAIGESGIFRRELPDSKSINIPVLEADALQSNSNPENNRYSIQHSLAPVLMLANP